MKTIQLQILVYHITRVNVLGLLCGTDLFATDLHHSTIIVDHSLTVSIGDRKILPYLCPECRKVWEVLLKPRIGTDEFEI